VPLGIINLMRSREDMTASGVLPGRFDDLGLQLQYWLRKAEHLTAAEVAESWGKVRTLQAEMAEFFRHADLLLTPATACVAYPAAALIPEIIDGRDASQSMAEPFGLIANICWNPSISIPVGVTRAGLPVGLQVIGRRHRDDVMLRLARILEQAQPWSFPWDADG